MATAAGSNIWMAIIGNILADAQNPVVRGGSNNGRRTRQQRAIMCKNAVIRCVRGRCKTLYAERPNQALTIPVETAVARPIPTPADMMQAMIEKGVTQENVAAFKELVILSEHMEDRNAQRDFAAAFVALQAELPTIVAKTIICD